MRWTHSRTSTDEFVALYGLHPDDLFIGAGKFAQCICAVRGVPRINEMVWSTVVACNARPGERGHFPLGYRLFMHGDQLVRPVEQAAPLAFRGRKTVSEDCRVPQDCVARFDNVMNFGGSETAVKHHVGMCPRRFASGGFVPNDLSRTELISRL